MVSVTKNFYSAGLQLFSHTY